MRRGAVYGLFLVSGASALMYELVWQRSLHLLFGTSTLAVSAVLAAFMGGLALGGALLGSWADRTSSPLRVYAALELGIAIAAALVGPALLAVAAGQSLLFAWLQPEPALAGALRFLLAFPVLLVPTALMGGTFPVMARLTRHANPGLFYGMNTLG